MSETALNSQTGFLVLYGVFIGSFLIGYLFNEFKVSQLKKECRDLQEYLENFSKKDLET